MSLALADVHPAAYEAAAYQLRYPCFCDPDRALAFPCNAQGCVEMDALSAPALEDYLYARVVVGREYGNPAVVPLAPP
jgi:hypothetical protein